MSYAALGASLRRVAAALLTVLVVAGLAGPAWADEQTATNTAAIATTTVAATGSASTTNGGTAVTGPAIAFAKAIVHQRNIQVVAGPPASRENVTQVATNDAAVTQTTTASSGNATTTDGGTAATGPAIAGSLAIVQQLNIQIVAGRVPAGGVTQIASNTAAVDQTTAAASGDATAAGSGSTARSGSASALSVSVIQQRNIQIFVGKPTGGGAETALQTAANAAAVSQTTLAATGAATASDRSTASSGNARAATRAAVSQVIRQLAR